MSMSRLGAGAGAGAGAEMAASLSKKAYESQEEWEARIKGAGETLAAQDGKSTDRLSEAQRLTPDGHSDNADDAQRKDSADDTGEAGKQARRKGGVIELIESLEKAGFRFPGSNSDAGDIMIHQPTKVEVGLVSGIVHIPDFATLNTFTINAALAAMTHMANYRLTSASETQSKHPLHVTPPTPPKKRVHDIESYTVRELIDELECRTWGKENILRISSLSHCKLTCILHGDTRA